MILRVLAIVASLSFFSFSFSRSPILSPARAARIDSAAVSTATREGRLAVFDDAWSTINDRYYDRTFHGLDWDGQRLVFRSRAAETRSSQELYEVLRNMIAPLDDPHTRVFSPEERFDWWHPRFVSIGIAVREVGGLPTVVKVERGSAPQRAGIRAGDVIESVNGAPALSLIKEKLAGNYANASSRYRAFAKIMDGPPESTVHGALPTFSVIGNSANWVFECAG
jgi:C-terminal processing protease CtpA/Prc